MESEKDTIQSAQKIPFLPNILTLGGIMCGMTAIIKVAQVPPNTLKLSGEAINFLTQGCWLIFAAMVFDVMDGKVARALDAVSAFGKELDSLADVISFGVAPAFVANRFLVMLLYASEREGVRNMLLLGGVSVVFVLCAAMRLARYNVETKKHPPQYMVGLPSPAAGGFIVANILFFVKYHETSWFRIVPYVYFFQSIFPFAVLVAALLMVSRIRFVHMGNILTARMKNFTFLVLSVFFILVIIWKPVEVFFAAIWIYLLAGIIPGIREYFRRLRTLQKKRSKTPENTENG